MDPKANLDEQIELANRILTGEVDDCDASYGGVYEIEDVYCLAELVLALHEWRSNGGFDPYVK